MGLSGRNSKMSKKNKKIKSARLRIDSMRMEKIWNRWRRKRATSKPKSRIWKEYAIFFQNGVLEIPQTPTRALNIFQLYLVTLLIPHLLKKKWIRPSAGKHPCQTTLSQ